MVPLVCTRDMVMWLGEYVGCDDATMGDVVESTYELWKVLVGNMLMGRARWMADEVGLALR